MEQILMHNSHEQLSELLNFNIDGLTPEEVQQLSDAQKEVKGILQDYLELVTKKKRDTKENIPEILPREISDNTEKPGTTSFPVQVQSFENPYDQLELIRVKNGTRITTPLSDGTTVIREVSITPEGLVVLSNIDKNRFGITNEIYMPNEYHMLTEKFRAGIYQHTPNDSTGTTRDQNVSATDKVPDATLDIVSAESFKNPQPHKSLADLLGVHTEKTESINIATERPVVDDIVPSFELQEKLTPAPVEVLKQEIHQINQILPVSLDKVAQQENSLLHQRTHEAAYGFIAQALTTALRPENIPRASSEIHTVTTPTLVLQKISDDQPPAPSTQTMSNNTKVNPLSMFASN